MGYGTDGLTLRGLRRANLERLSEFKNAKGEPAHTVPDGSDWSPNDWLGAVIGEVGEAANLIKKARRGDLSMDEARPLIADELADAQTYLDLLAYRCGIDLAEATTAKWNRVSLRVGSGLYIGTDGDWHRRVPAVVTTPTVPQLNQTPEQAKELAEYGAARAAVDAARSLAAFLEWKRPDLEESATSIRGLGEAIARAYPIQETDNAKS